MIRAYFQLMRFPAVFTAIADIFLGFLLNHARLSPLDDFLKLVAASSCLYLAGMVWNDIFDRDVDARERPKRPLPSARVSFRSAITLASVLLILGNLSAWLVGLRAGLTALGLTACIFAYDALLKYTPLGPLAMGGCRFLNILLGASAATTWIAVWRWDPVVWVALGMGAYIAGVTWFGRHEAEESPRKTLIAGACVINLGLILHLLWIERTTFGDPRRTTMLLAFAVLMLILNRRIWTAVISPTAARVQEAMTVLLLSIIVLDATLLFVKTQDPRLAAMTIVLLVPAVILKRFMAVT